MGSEPESKEGKWLFLALAQEGWRLSDLCRVLAQGSGCSFHVQLAG